MEARRIAVLAAVLAEAFALPLGAQEGGKLSLTLTPGANLVVGASASLFTIGAGAELAAVYSMPFAPFIVARGSVDYSMVPTTGPSNMSLITVAAGFGVSLDVIPRLNLQASVSGGWGEGLYEGQPGGSAYASAEAGVTFLLAPSFGLGLGASYRHYVSVPTPFYQAIRVNLGAVFRLGAGTRKARIEIPAIRFDPLFPVFYKHYVDHPVGQATIRNSEPGTIRDVKVSFYVAQYMDKPHECAAIAEMKKGEERQVDLCGLFTNQVLTITEGTKVNAVVRVDYKYGDSDLNLERSETLRMHDRNAMTWDDDRRAAAFVTARDPEVLRFSKRVEGLVREQGSAAVNLTFRKAMAVFETLGLYGMVYAVDTKTPYAELSKSDTALDSLQFPVHTLGYKAGDCDDLSILYCALLESLAVDTAFITVPGHIFAAFSLGIEPAQAKELFLNPGDLIESNGAAWVPVEITMMQSGFLEAWARAAREWRDAEREGSADLYPTHDAWTIYEPVGLPEAGNAVVPPTEDEILSRYTRALTRFVEREISATVEDLRNKIRDRPGEPRLINKLGVIYAQYGVLDKAEAEFERAATLQYVPAFVNLGNICLMQKKLEKALGCYRMAERSLPDEIAVLVGLARVYYEREEFTEVRGVFDRLQRKSPDTADKYAYLVGGSGDRARASAATGDETMLWVREE